MTDREIIKTAVAAANQGQRIRQAERRKQRPGRETRLKASSEAMAIAAEPLRSLIGRLTYAPPSDSYEKLRRDARKASLLLQYERHATRRILRNCQLDAEAAESTSRSQPPHASASSD